MSFQIRIKDAENNITTINVSKHMLISTVKNLYKEKTGTNFNNEYMLFFKTKMIDDNQTVESCKIKPNSTLSLLNVEANSIIAALYIYRYDKKI
jgi:hypothetical protein